MVIECIFCLVLPYSFYLFLQHTCVLLLLLSRFTSSLPHFLFLWLSPPVIRSSPSQTMASANVAKNAGAYAADRLFKDWMSRLEDASSMRVAVSSATTTCCVGKVKWEECAFRVGVQHSERHCKLSTRGTQTSIRRRADIRYHIRGCHLRLACEPSLQLVTRVFVPVILDHFLYYN